MSLIRIALLNAIVVSVLLIAGVSCGGYHSLPATWFREIPGEYEGVRHPFREILRLESDGTYTHSVFYGTNILVKEGGKWTAGEQRFEIKLFPASAFSEFYDPATSTFSTNSRPAAAYTYFPLPEGKTFSKISASVDFDLTLTRIPEP